MRTSTLGIVSVTILSAIALAYLLSSTPNQSSTPYLNEVGYQRKFLASYPRSGNHWVRYLIEEATNITTGSVYKDRTRDKLPNVRSAHTGAESHLKMAFPWGMYSPPNGYEGNRRYPTVNDPVVIKTHYPSLGKRPFDGDERTVCIVRNPIDSIGSYFDFTELTPDKWSTFIKKQAKIWKEFHKYRLSDPKTTVILYEDLYANPKIVLRRILENLEFHPSNEDIQRAVDQYPPRGKLFSRRAMYTEEQLEFLRQETENISAILGYKDLW